MTAEISVHMYVARLAVKSLEHLESIELRGGAGLEYFMQGKDVGFSLERYRVELEGLLLQDPGSGELLMLRRGESLVLRRAEASPLCRWHTGPIDERDDPMQRRYCINPAASGLGYCKEHAGSLRALYDMCFGSSGTQSRIACARLDQAMGRKVQYAVYIADYGGRSLKVGSTRLFRWVDRIAEQPHAAAALIHTTTSAVDARGVEKSIASGKGFAEIPARNRLKLALQTPYAEAARHVASVARMLARQGYKWDGSVIRVEPPPIIAEAKEASPKSLEGKRLILDGYWGGYLLLAGDSGTYMVASRRIAHRARIAVSL